MNLGEIMPIKVGDLVCLYRRKHKGMGMVLEAIEDIEEVSGLDGFECIVKMRSMNSWDSRRDYKMKTIRESKNEDAANLFWEYHEYAHSPKIKTSFVKVRWFKRPSNYETRTIREDSGWYPTSWLKKQQ
jgi:hypothetical protein